METKEALECVEGICAVPGLDSIVYGGMDWSGSLGFPHLPTWDLIEKEPEMLAAYDRVCAACKASGERCDFRPIVSHIQRVPLRNPRLFGLTSVSVMIVPEFNCI